MICDIIISKELIGISKLNSQFRYFPAMPNLVLMEQLVEMMRWKCLCTTAIVRTVTLERIAKVIKNEELCLSVLSGTFYIHICLKELSDP